MICELKAPARPRSAVTSRSATRFLGSCSERIGSARDVAGGLGGLARHAPDRARVGPQVLDALLGAAQARGGDHLHRARDLLDVLDRRDAVLDVALAHGGERVPSGRGRLLLGVSAVTASSPASPRRRRRGLCAPSSGAAGSAVVVERLALLVEVVAEVVGELRDRLVDRLLGLVGPVAAGDLLEQVVVLGVHALGQALEELARRARRRCGRGSRWWRRRPGRPGRRPAAAGARSG